jgi:hypothetical protein
MTDFWYHFSLGSRRDVDLAQLCVPKVPVEVVLYDHNNSKIPATLECNQE